MALLKVISFALVLGFAENVFVSGQGCTLNLPNDIPAGTDPVMFLDEGGDIKYAVPTEVGSKGAIRLGKNQDLVVSCPGDRNYISVANQQTSNAKCVSEQTMSVNGAQHQMKQLKCQQKATPTVKDTKKSCANGNGTLVEIGYSADTIGWRKLLESCHNIKKSFSYYSKHTLYGTAIGSRVHGHGRPKFSRGSSEFYSGFDPDKAFGQKNQGVVLANIVGPQNVGQYLQPKKNLFMARGHFAPDGDFLFTSWQAASFFFINAAPQWQTINGGNWNQVEAKTRDFAEKKSVDLEVVTGTYGIMKIFGKEVYLAPNERLPAPDLYWKVVRRPSDNACIAFVSTNNPFLKSPPTHICSNICQAQGWPVNFSDLRTGYVYCCDYKSIKAAIDYVPNMTCNSVLSYN